MTENEAIDIIHDKIETCEFYFAENDRYPKWCEYEFLESLGAAISALKEIQQYREIGTVEECREAVEKQKPKKPEIYTDTVQTMNGSFQRDVFECPVCGDYVCNVEDEIPNYCCSCGQKLEESEEE